MARSKRIDQEIFDVLQLQFKNGKGVKRHGIKPKGVFSIQSDLIHSKNTFDTYRQHGKAFAKWARAKGIRHLKEVKKGDIAEWLEERRALGDSPDILKTRGAALAKIFGCSSTDFGFTFPVRKSEHIKRSRGKVKMDGRFNKKLHEDIVTIAKATGLRRSELQRVQKSQVEIRDGRAYISQIKGKGGLIRDIPVLLKYQDAVIRIFDGCRGKKLFIGKIPTYIDIHSYREEYAKAYYDEIVAAMQARGEKVPLDYRTRGMARVSLNKNVVQQVSLALGHKRVGVTVTNYLKHHFS